MQEPGVSEVGNIRGEGGSRGFLDVPMSDVQGGVRADGELPRAKRGRPLGSGKSKGAVQGGDEGQAQNLQYIGAVVPQIIADLERTSWRALDLDILEESVRRTSHILETMKRTYNEMQEQHKSKLLCFTCGVQVDVPGRKIKYEENKVDPITGKKDRKVVCSEPCYQNMMVKTEKERRIREANIDALMRAE